MNYRLVFCDEGQRTEPYEQKTQQSPGWGRRTAEQPLHVWKNTQASVGMSTASV